MNGHVVVAVAAVVVAVAAAVVVVACKRRTVGCFRQTTLRFGHLIRHEPLSLKE